ncbi:restriction endonuclease subunit S [Alteromonas hispanica]|uniref:Restriction endonuclease subunit S n=1 Tax=Alteromonas hispanica TaxID=315421 RepID=A0A6L9MR00_9ALTE|nr:restriction endonuclease subunit S [Alteromonas hispanica]NDW20400.1 restriction endonuclease subunit S [Alteromonas hispanica]
MALIPPSWKDCTLEDIASIVSGGTPKSTVTENFCETGGVAWLTPADLSGYGVKTISRGKRNLTEIGYQSCSAKKMPKGSVLYSSRAPIGYVVIAENEISTNQGFKSFVPEQGVDSNYLYYYLMSIKHIAESKATGTTFKELSSTATKSLPFVAAPENEQKRITEKLDRLLAQVDTIQQRLNNLPDIIKRFRQSVLAAAVSGKLTEQWREGNNVKAWKDIILKDAANIIDPQPSHRTPPVVEGGVPYVGIGDLMVDGSIDFERARKVSFDVLKEHKERYQLKEGDFLFGKIGTLGKATKLPMDIDYTLSANVILIQPLLDVVLPEYLTFFLSAPTTMNEVAKQSNSTSQAAFGIKKMRAFNCELPDLREQTEIVRQIEQYFALAGTLEKHLANAKIRVDNLTQSILAKAFRGELVPQDPNDEPADKLLERIKAARLEAEKLEKTAKKAAKVKR